MVNIDDKYLKRKGSVLISGTQALVRMTLLQRELDRRDGLSTAGYVSGYRGSPLGGVDLAMWAAQKHLEANDITFAPGVNEELAATAVWGTQKIDVLGDARVQGVYAFWYGKGPGVDRSGDAFRHGNQTGAHQHGGVLVAMGDDHLGKSSSVTHHSEQSIAAHWMPVLFPADVEDVLRLGLMGWAMSRYSGCWVGFKMVGEVAEQTATVHFDIANLRIERPPYPANTPTHLLHYSGTYAPMQTEMVAKRHRLPLAQAFARANGLDRLVFGDADAHLGIVTAGKAYRDVLQALQYLGIDATKPTAYGLALYKVAMIWPLEPEGLKDFAAGKKELLFIEEKSAFMESQAAELLYNAPIRPRIVGKRNELGTVLLTSDNLLEPRELAALIIQRLRLLGFQVDGLEERLREQAACPERALPVVVDAAAPTRTPFYCSGCPHNTSTTVPEGSLALSGIGCHGMAVWAKPGTKWGSQMGGEGVDWIGAAPFSRREHVFQNLGEGTYYHSGHLAIRAAVASGVNITYKILYNDAVAMTGGQPVDGPISVQAVAHQVVHEGVKKVILVTDDPSRYARATGLPEALRIEHRDALPRVQDALRRTPGCTVLIYEQTCAAEKRRRRKRNAFPTPDERLFIYDAVCEGCGDCSRQSNCISIEPKVTALGVKRQINQSSCNLDFSCIKGFCPSFVTVHGATLRKPQARRLDERLLDALPLPVIPALEAGAFSILVAGVGGTGVITVAQVLAMAAHLDGRTASTYDMTGMAQKNGGVLSHLKIATHLDAIGAQRIGPGDASLVLGFDLVAATSDDAFRSLNGRTTHFVGNTTVQPTPAFVSSPDAIVALNPLVRKVRRVVDEERITLVDATGLAVELCGDAIASNMFMVGVVAQRGLLPLSIDAIQRAIEINGVQVKFNLTAFALGRLWVANPDAIRTEVSEVADATELAPQEQLQRIVADRVQRLAEYQDDSCAHRYAERVERVREVEQRVSPGSTALTEAVARNLAKLIMIKDEYEVARLYSSAEFRTQLESQFSDFRKISFSLAPPVLFAQGAPRKRKFGPWVLTLFGILARMRGLRGGWFDVFGYTRERREERALLANYEAMLDELLPLLNIDRLTVLTQLAQVPERIRGYGHVKHAAMQEAEQTRASLLAQFHADHVPEIPENHVRQAA